MDTSDRLAIVNMSNAYTVNPAGSRNETAWLISITIILLLCATILITKRSRGEDQIEILDWQISAFHDLSPADQAIYNALDLAGEEIFYLQYYLGHWPTMVDMDEFLLPPFYRDMSWKQTGEVNWVLKPMAEGSIEGTTVYHGSGGKIAGQGAYLLMIMHIHAGATGAADAHTVWLHPDADSVTPEVIKKNSLIRNGWKQIVPYTGDMERKRLKG